MFWRNTLKNGKFKDRPPDPLPRRNPVVKDILWLLIIPCPLWHRIDESETHVDLSNAVCPILRKVEEETRPIFTPTTVALTDPVVAKLASLIALISLVKEEKPFETLLACPPTVTDKRLLRIVPYPCLLRREVSDLHDVDSHTVSAGLNTCENVARPKPVPYNVTLRDPVVAIFASLNTLTPFHPADHPLLTLPQRLPVVNVESLVNCTDCPP